MNKVVLTSLFCGLLLCACGHTEKHSHSHEELDHAEHNHSHEGHDHSHEGHNHSHESHNHQAESQHAAHGDEIVLSKEKAESAGVKAKKISKGTMRSAIQTSGHLIASQGDEASAVASMAGIIRMARPITEGTKVQKGEVLFTISADKLQDGDPAEKARIAYDVAKAEYERAESLLADKLITMSAFNAAKEKYETARIAYEATASNGKAGATVKAPISGYIRNCNVRPGDYVSTGQFLADIAMSNRLYLQADMPLRHFKAMGEIASANFSTDYSDKVFSTDNLNGKLLAVGKTVSEASAFIPVTFEIDHSCDLIAGSFVKVTLLGKERQGVISLPLTAITEEQGVNFIYIQDDATCYHKQEVTLGMNDGKQVEILSGLHGGETVVIEGAIHVRLASANNSIPGHTHNH